ncbi:unnamed protein product [Caenorhabditis brenneri]
MKVLKLPYLALAHLLRLMTLPDVFMLSFCSRRMKRIIQTIKLKAFKMKFVFEEAKCIIWIETMDVKIYPIISTETIPQFIKKDRPHYFQIGDVKVNHFLEQIKFHSSHCNIVYLKELENSFEKALVDHASTFFSNSPVLQLKTDLNRNLPTMTGIQEINLSGQYYEGIDDDVETFLSKLPNLNSIHIEFTPKDLDYFSKLVRIPNLYGYETDLVKSKVLNFFKGRVAIFSDAICDSDVLKVFLRKWIKYRLYPNLKILHIDLNQLVPDELNPLDILENIRTKDWDPNQRPQFFEYEHPILGYETTTDCSTWIDIEREQDGKLVSVKIEQNCFYFYVWN